MAPEFEEDKRRPETEADDEFGTGSHELLNGNGEAWRLAA